jgi:metal-responsive CopG/Arc/MetJ family transcriptional regulator
MNSVQISIDEKLLKDLNRFAKTSGLSRSEIVRKAVKAWIRQREIREFEENWIKKSKQRPVNFDESEAWLLAEKGSETN